MPLWSVRLCMWISLNFQGLSFILEKDSACGAAPQIDGIAVDSLISGSAGSGKALIIAIEDMKCTEAVKAALSARGAASPEVHSFTGPFAYASGSSNVWDWLHCTYPNDASSSGMTMHSYVFVDGTFIGEGFAAATKIQSGSLDSQIGAGSQTCAAQYAHEASIVSNYMNDASNKVLLFGWLGCPCVGDAVARLGAASVCYKERTWGEPDAKIMKYLQCKHQSTNHHSFIYFRNSSESSGWTFAGNGFELKASSNADFQALVTVSSASTSCKQATVAFNLYGEALEECRAGDDSGGSWDFDGKCTELSGGVHQVCIENLPADFSSETHQSAWSKGRVDKRHCVCIGAWSLYMTDAAKHQSGADSIMPHCKSVPETVLTAHYLEHWKKWNGYDAAIVTGVEKLVSLCLSASGITNSQKCGLKARYESMKSSITELSGASELATLDSSMGQLTCP